jgi:outer membrane protein
MPSTQAQNLVTLYNAAQSYDASYQSAKSQFDATLAKADQAIAGLLPNVNLAISANQTNLSNSLTPQVNRDYGTQTGTVSASQPLYRAANWATYGQGKKQTELAQFQLTAARQDLIIRISQAYFDVLTAQDNLTFIRNQKIAVSEQLAFAKRNFEVGTSTIVDTRDAQARYDLVVAQELAVENDLRIKSLALDQLVGQSTIQPKPLRTPIQLAAIEPADIAYWITQAETHNPAIQQQALALAIAKLETEKAQAGHKPTLDLVASYSANNNDGSATGSTQYKINQGVVGLSFNLPLFSGFASQNRIRETLSLEDKALNDFQATQRSITQAVRTAYLGLQTGLAQVKAFEAAEASTQSALDANKLGYQVGVKINIDVLNSQSQLFDTKAKLAKARYDVLVGGLKLRQAAGTLQAEDLDAINAQLSP